MNKILIIATACCIVLIGCGKEKSTKGQETNKQENKQNSTWAISHAVTKVDYKVLHDYFVVNTIEDSSVISVVIDTKEKFDNYFTVGRTMNSTGEFTPIDFSKSFVIAIIGPVSDKATNISAISLKDRDAHLEFIYSIESEKEPRSFSIHPFIGIVVDKNHYKDVKFIME